MAEKIGLSLLNSMSSLPRLHIILKAIGAEQPKEEIADFYKASIAKRLNTAKTNIHVTFNSDFTELISLSNIKESQKEGGEKYLYTKEGGVKPATQQLPTSPIPRTEEETPQKEAAAETPQKEAAAEKIPLTATPLEKKRHVNPERLLKLKKTIEDRQRALTLAQLKLNVALSKKGKAVKKEPEKPSTTLPLTADEERWLVDNPGETKNAARIALGNQNLGLFEEKGMIFRNKERTGKERKKLEFTEEEAAANETPEGKAKSQQQIKRKQIISKKNKILATTSEKKIIRENLLKEVFDIQNGDIHNRDEAEAFLKQTQGTTQDKVKGPQLSAFRQEQENKSKTIDRWKNEQSTFKKENDNLISMIEKSKFGSHIAAINLFSKK